MYTELTLNYHFLFNVLKTKDKVVIIPSDTGKKLVEIDIIVNIQQIPLILPLQYNYME